MIEVRVIEQYYDRELDEVKKVGDTFEVEEDRANHLVGFGVVEIIKEEVKATTSGWFR